jgi:hypothetical protein
MVHDETSMSPLRRFRRIFLANLDDLFPGRRPDLDRFEVLVFLLFAIMVSTLVTLASSGPILEAFSPGWGITLIVAVALLSGPLLLVAGLAGFVVFMTSCDVIIEVSEPGHNRRKDLRSVLRRLHAGHRALRSGWEGLDDARFVYGIFSRFTSPKKGLWTKVLYRRAARRHDRLGRRITAVYQDSLPLATSLLRKNYGVTSTDASLVAWRNPYPLRSLEVERLLEEYVTFDRSVLEETRRPVGVLLFTPRWVFELIAAGRHSYEDRLFYPGMRRTGSRIGIGPAVLLHGANPETVEKLYEPYSDGPMGNLEEVVGAALLLD